MRLHDDENCVCEFCERVERSMMRASLMAFLIWVAFASFILYIAALTVRCAVSHIALAFVLAVSFLTGCGAAAPEVRYVDKVVSVPVHVLCAHDAPPVLAPVVSFTCTATVCSLTIADAATLADNIERLKSWVAQTWALCAPTEVK